jgi:hypothetical protein
MESLVNRNRDNLLSAMPLVKRYSNTLESLNEWWAKIALIGKINSHSVASTILSDMDDTRKKFIALQQTLIENLVIENLKKETADSAARAQVAIDILIRNLFERTADVGFLATDDDIRDFLTKPNPSEEDKTFLRSRLQEYVRKYSVYDEIVVLTPGGEVKVHLDDRNPIATCHDRLIAETLKSNATYVETFRHSDIQPRKRHSLIYSARIQQSNAPGSPTLGVLCLCFRFDNEMESIFSNLLRKDPDTVLLILDGRGTVIASSNEIRVSLGRCLKYTHEPAIVEYESEDYLVRTLKTNGYQGFRGLGWSAHVMSPLRKMFCEEWDSTVGNIDASVIDRAQMFSEALKEIRRTSTIINDDLSLVVLNGKIRAARTDSKEFMPVLEAIKRIGEDTANIFSDSIRNLQATVIRSHLDDVTFMASLAVDIMDRNLYERANDCRWWALTSAFRRLLSGGVPSEQDVREITAILQYINSLYTVYTNLYVYDRQGKILAVSNVSEGAIIGTRVGEDEGAAQALREHDSQRYSVSPFRKTSLYGGRHTYVYNAAITDIDRPADNVGGIGIVFDSEPQFRAMIEDALPKEESGRTRCGCFGMFVDRDGAIISVANNSEYNVGDLCGQFDKEIASLPRGGALSKIVSINGTAHAMGVSVAQGYREYKTTGDYDNDVIALFFSQF